MKRFIIFSSSILSFQVAAQLTQNNFESNSQDFNIERSHQDFSDVPQRRKRVYKRHNLSDKQVKTFKQMQAEVKQAYERELKEEIKKNPRKRKELIKLYNRDYRNEVLALGREYKSGKIKLVERWKAPSLAGTIPTGFAGSLGQVFLGGALSSGTRFSAAKDWSLAGGLGLLNPDKWVGVTVSAVIDSVTSGSSAHYSDNFKFKGKLFDRGGMNFKVGRSFFDSNCSVAVGYDHLLHWGMDSESERFIQNTSAAVSCIYRRESIDKFANTFLFTVGAGNRIHQSYRRWAINRKDGIGPFAGVGVRFWKAFGAYLETKNNEYNTGVSVAPFQSFPWVFSITLTNLTKKDSERRPVVFAGVIAFNF